MKDYESIEHGKTKVKTDRGEIIIYAGSILVDSEDLIPYVNNPKKHPDEQVSRIADQIVKHGWDQQIVVDGNLEIVIGHGRLRAAKKLGMDKVPVVIRDDFTDLDAKERRIADNKLAESEWDKERAEKELQQLIDADDHDELMTGHSDDELSQYLDNLDSESDGSTSVDTSGSLNAEFEVVVEAEDEAEQEKIFNELVDKYGDDKCRLLTL